MYELSIGRKIFQLMPPTFFMGLTLALLSLRERDDTLRCYLQISRLTQIDWVARIGGRLFFDMFTAQGTGEDLRFYSLNESTLSRHALWEEQMGLLNHFSNTNSWQLCQLTSIETPRCCLRRHQTPYFCLPDIIESHLRLESCSERPKNRSTTV